MLLVVIVRLRTPSLVCFSQWYLQRDEQGEERAKPYSSNLLDAAAGNVLVGYPQQPRAQAADAQPGVSVSESGRMLALTRTLLPFAPMQHLRSCWVAALWCAGAVRDPACPPWLDWCFLVFAREMLAQYQQMLADGALEAFRPLSTRQLLQRLLLKLDNGPQQAVGYTCLAASAKLVDTQQLEEEHHRNLDLLVAAAADSEARAADAGAAAAADDLLGEPGEQTHRVTLYDGDPSAARGSGWGQADDGPIKQPWLLPVAAVQMIWWRSGT